MLEQLGQNTHALRYERDGLGEVAIPADAPWGPVTQRALEHFRVGEEKMPKSILLALIEIKRSAAMSNAAVGKISPEQARIIVACCEELLASSDLSSFFPLPVWQTGSGTQSNMNVNEVLSTLAQAKAQAEQTASPIDPKLFHPNDVINASQSSNDVFPTAMHLALLGAYRQNLRPALCDLITSLQTLQSKFGHVIKSGRTHLMDATPIYFGQECEAWIQSLSDDLQYLDDLQFACTAVPLGGTAVGTGLNAPEKFAEKCCEELSRRYQIPIHTVTAPARHMASKSAMLVFHGALRALATDLFKLASDLRLLASGPRCGLGELELPAGEPGSSIMPGKVNPTQCEMLTMLCLEVFGNDQVFMMAASQGHLQLNVFMPLMAYKMQQSLGLLSDGLRSFQKNCVDGIQVHAERMAAYVENSLMRVTALAPQLGYLEASRLAHLAHEHGTSLRQEVLAAQLMDEKDFEKATDPARLCGHLGRGNAQHDK